MRSMKITPLSNAKIAIALIAVLSMNMALSEIVHVGAARPLSGTPLPTTIDQHLKASVNMTGNDEERTFGSFFFDGIDKLRSKMKVDAFVAKRETMNSNDDMVTFMRSEKDSNEGDVATFLYKYRDDKRIGRYCSPMLDHLFEQWKEDGETIQTIIPVLTSHLDRKVLDQQTTAVWKLYAEKFVPVGDNWSLYNKMLNALTTFTPYAQLAPGLKLGSSKDFVFRCLYGALLKSELNEGKTPAMFRDTIEVTDFHDVRIKIWYDYVTLYIYKGSVVTSRDKVVGETARNKRADEVDFYQTKFRDQFKLTFPRTSTTERGVKNMPEMLRLYWHRSGKDLLAHGSSYYDFMEKMFPSPKSST